MLSPLLSSWSIDHIIVPPRHFILSVRGQKFALACKTYQRICSRYFDLHAVTIIITNPLGITPKDPIDCCCIVVSRFKIEFIYDCKDF
jgi:hypothetical protein